jgi:hypothetical protein
MGLRFRAAYPTEEPGRALTRDDPLHVFEPPGSAQNAHLSATFAVPGSSFVTRHYPLTTFVLMTSDSGHRTFYLIHTKPQHWARSGPACHAFWRFGASKFGLVSFLGQSWGGSGRNHSLVCAAYSNQIGPGVPPVYNRADLPKNSVPNLCARLAGGQLFCAEIKLKSKYSLQIYKPLRYHGRRLDTRFAEEASPLPGSFRASPNPSLGSSAEADGLAHGCP